MGEPWQDWTPCEMYGHVFSDTDGTPRDTCRDCPERSER
jgi:hypothetical protein